MVSGVDKGQESGLLVAPDWDCWNDDKKRTEETQAEERIFENPLYRLPAAFLFLGHGDRSHLVKIEFNTTQK